MGVVSLQTDMRHGHGPATRVWLPIRFFGGSGGTGYRIRKEFALCF